MAILGPIEIGVLTDLVATAVATAAGRTWMSFRGKPEARAIRAAINEALYNSLRDSGSAIDTDIEDDWIIEVAKIWVPAFTPEVLQELITCLVDPADDQARRFADKAERALEEAGCDLAELQNTFWIAQFLSLLPRNFLGSLSAAALRDPNIRDLVDHLLRLRTIAQTNDKEPALPREFRQDLFTLLQRLVKQAQSGRLPPYLPAQTDIISLSRTVRVRLGIRHDSKENQSTNGLDTKMFGPSYRLPADRLYGISPPVPWSTIATERQVVVLADAGLGKSWLIRIETHRIAQSELALFADSLDSAIIPIPLRCDQLVAAGGDDLAEKAVAHLVAQKLVPERSRAGLEEKVRRGEIVLLLDALDELSPTESGPLRDLVLSWVDQLDGRARCVVTSRIAGYTGSPLPHAYEVELQAFTPDDVTAVIRSWRLPSMVSVELFERVKDPAIAAMARIPLLLALLCSLAAQLSAGQALPRTRGQLYDRVLRWFLTRAHRSRDDPAEPMLDAVEIDGLLEILAPLAFAFANAPSGWIDLMPAERLLSAIRAIGPAFSELHRPAAEVLREVSVEAGVIVPSSDPSAGRSPSYLFLHRTIAEYLVAHHLATLEDEEWSAVVEQHRWFDSNWVGVIPMLGERLNREAARMLLERLLFSKIDPFYYSLFTALRVWGARSDGDGLLSPSQTAEVADSIDKLLCHPVTRQAMTSALAGMAYIPQMILHRVVARLREDDSWQVRAAAAKVLTGQHASEITEELVERLHDDSSSVRAASAEALTGREAPGVIEALLARLTDEDMSVQGAAVRALAGREAMPLS
jgi:hypothetical protein